MSSIFTKLVGYVSGNTSGGGGSTGAVAPDAGAGAGPPAAAPGHVANAAKAAAPRLPENAMLRGVDPEVAGKLAAGAAAILEDLAAAKAQAQEKSLLDLPPPGPPPPLQEKPKSRAKKVRY